VNLKQAKRSSLTEQVAEQLQHLIESGAWPVGTRIPAEPELVEQLGVSRNTIREAVRALVHVGMLEAKQGDGTYVCADSDLKAAMARRLRRSNIAETMEARHALEREAARLAAMRRGPDDVDRLRASLKERDRTMAGTDKAEAVKADMALHLAVMQATHNGLLIDLYGHMTEALYDSIDGTLFLDAVSNEVHERAHRELVEAIIAQDADAAERAADLYIGVLLRELRSID